MDATAERLARAIGARIRQERRALDWTLDRLAETAGVSRRMVVNVEQGAVNPSVGTLLRLAEALGIGLPSLVEPPAETPTKLTRHGDGAVLWTGGAGGRAVLVAGTAAPDVVELWDWTLGPGDRYESGAHPDGTRELLQVQSGALTVDVDGVAHELLEGDALAFPGDAAHAYDNPGAVPARFSLAVFEPGVGLIRRGDRSDA